MRRVLVVEDDEQLRDSTQRLLQLDGVVIEAVGTAHEALQRLATEQLRLRRARPQPARRAAATRSSRRMAGSEQYSFPPVIVYTGRALSPEDEERLRRYSRSIIVKGARSPERLLDEVTLFLHQVESRLPADAQRLLRDGTRARRALRGQDDPASSRTTCATSSR